MLTPEDLDEVKNAQDEFTKQECFFSSYQQTCSALKVYYITSSRKYNWIRHICDLHKDRYKKGNVNYEIIELSEKDIFYLQIK